MTLDEAIAVLNERKYLGYDRWGKWGYEDVTYGVDGPRNMLRMVRFNKFEAITIAQALQDGVGMEHPN